MSTGTHAHAHAREPTQKPSSPNLRAPRGYGSPRALWGGIAAVSAGLAGFWYYQKYVQYGKEEDVRPGAIPTWEYRLQQQHDPVTHPNDPLTQRVSEATRASRPKDVPLPRSGSSQGQGSTVSTAAHGKGSEDTATQSSSDRVGQPAAQGQKNDSNDAAGSKKTDAMKKD